MNFSTIYSVSASLIGIKFYEGRIVFILLSFARFLNAMIGPIYSVKINKEISSINRGTFLSIISLFVSFGIGITDPLIGFITDYKGLEFTYFLLGILSMFIGVIIFTIKRSK